MKQTNQSKPNIIDTLGLLILMSLMFDGKSDKSKPIIPTILLILLLALITTCCTISYYIGYRSGCTTTGMQAKLYEAIVDPHKLKSGLPHTIEIAATTEESARKIAIEQGMPNGEFSLRPKVKNYITVRQVQLCP